MLKSQFAKSCLQGEGKGRIQLPSGRFLFSYESIFDLEKKILKMGLQIPIYGEETFELNFKDKRKTTVRGNFYKRLLQNMTQEKEHGKYSHNLQRFIKLFGKYLRYMSDVKSNIKLEKINCKNKKGEVGVCKTSARKNKILFHLREAHFIFLLYGENNSRLYIDSLQGDLFSKRKLLKFQHKNKHGAWKTVLSLTLFHKSCEL